MCFGVRDALHATAEVADPTQVTIHGELVHNPRVSRQLVEAGFRQSTETGRNASAPTPIVMITAHGVSHAERRRLAAAGKTLIDTTCPLVRRAHDAAQELQAEGRHILLIGKAGHVEVQGIVEDLESCDVLGSVDQVGRYESRRLGVLCQTTMQPALVGDICARIRSINPDADIRVIDTVCRPTKLRQRALLALVDQVNAVVVVGGRNSNNTRWLVHVCQEHHLPAFHVECADDLNPDWFADVATVGLTAGTSTLDETIDEVHRALERMGSEHTS